LKEALAEDIKACLDAFDQVLSKDSRRYNDLIMQKAKFTAIRKDSAIDLISNSDLELSYAKVRNGLLYLIDELKEADLAAAAPPPTAPSPEGLFTTSDFDRLEQQGLKSQAELLQKKLNLLREALAIEDDPTRILKYETQIAKAEKEIENLRTRLR
jgi:hypothetical protein